MDIIEDKNSIDIIELEKDINFIKKNINNKKINIQIFLTKNNIIESIINKKQYYNDKISIKLIKDILDKIKKDYCKNDYEINYLLNFNMNMEIDNLNNIYKLSAITNETLNNLKNNIDYNDIFNNINSLIIVLEKKFYFKESNNKKRKNSTKKNKY